MTQAASPQRGFWKLHHDDLQAFLQCSGLSWESARVFLALGDLTLGWGRDKGIVSVGDIARFAGMRRKYVLRAIARLRELGLYGENRLSDRQTERWILLPERAGGSPEAGGTQGVTDSPEVGANSPEAGATNGPDLGATLKTKDVKTPRLTAGKGGHQQFVEWFCAEYERQTGIKYKFQKGKDGSAVKALVKEHTFGELQALTKAMLQDKWGRENASPANLRGQINKWRLKALPPGQTPGGKEARRKLDNTLAIITGKAGKETHHGH